MAFDWVTAHSECSASKVFKELRTGVKSDIDVIDAMLAKTISSAGHGTKPKFDVSDEPTRFLVSRQIKNGEAAQTVEFALNGLGISIEGFGIKPFQAIVDLNLDGKCVLTVDGNEVESWQVRRMALHKLLFVP